MKIRREITVRNEQKKQKNNKHENMKFKKKGLWSQNNTSHPHRYKNISMVTKTQNTTFSTPK